MRVLLFSLLSLVLFCDPSSAASECSAIKSKRARLACFDKEQPAMPQSSKARTKAGAKDGDFSDRSNPFAKEDAATTAKLRGICRGC